MENKPMHQFQRVKNLPDNIRDIAVLDLCSPFETSIGSFRYLVTWIDLKSWFANIKFLKNKECKTISGSFKCYFAWLLWQKKADVKKIRADNRGEYTGKEFQYICSKLSIIHETTSPYTPEHNGIAKQYNRTLQEGALTLWHDSELSSKFWVSAIHTVNFVRNHILHSQQHLSIWSLMGDKAQNRLALYIWLQVLGPCPQSYQKERRIPISPRYFHRLLQQLESLQNLDTTNPYHPQSTRCHIQWV